MDNYTKLLRAEDKLLKIYLKSLENIEFELKSIQDEISAKTRSRLEHSSKLRELKEILNILENHEKILEPYCKKKNQSFKKGIFFGLLSIIPCGILNSLFSLVSVPIFLIIGLLGGLSFFKILDYIFKKETADIARTVKSNNESDIKSEIQALELQIAEIIGEEHTLKEESIRKFEEKDELEATINEIRERINIICERQIIAIEKLVAQNEGQLNTIFSCDNRLVRMLNRIENETIEDPT